MASHLRYEFRGRRECPHCHRESGSEYGIRSATGAPLGRLEVRTACACYGAQQGEELDRVEHMACPVCRREPCWRKGGLRPPWTCSESEATSREVDRWTPPAYSADRLPENET